MIEYVEVLFLGAIVFLGVFGVLALFHLLKKRTEIKRMLSLQTLIGTIDWAIKRELTHMWELKYRLKDIKHIYKFEDEMTEIVNAVIHSFGDEFMRQMLLYFSREYIYVYITKSVKIALIEFIRENKIKTK